MIDSPFPEISAALENGSLSLMEWTKRPLRLGPLEIPNRVFLAPLAGVSDVPFRRICQEHGAGLTYVEMLSATALTYGNKKTFDMLRRHPSEHTLGVQLTGDSAEVVARGAEILEKEGFDTLDVNMGCPVKKIVHAGCGSAILRDPDRVSKTLEAIKGRIAIPFSAKIRIGYTRDELNVEDISRRVAQTAAMLTIHGRTRSESYNTPVDLVSIQQGFAAARRVHPESICVSNGDIFGASSAEAHIRETHSSALMVSRGALGNPWIFQKLLDPETPEPRLDEWYDVVMRHLEYHEEHYGKTTLAAILSRKHLLWYSKGFPGGKKLRDSLSAIQDLTSARELLTAFRRNSPADLRRYDSGAHHPGEAKEAPCHSYDPKYEMDRKLDRGVGDDGLLSGRSVGQVGRPRLRPASAQ